MDFLDDLSNINFDLKYMLILFNFVTIAFLIVYRRLNPTKPGEKHPVVIVTSHPDDECMFFQPTIKNINKNHQLHLLCLSGNETRKRELQKAVQRLQIKSYKCVEHQNLKDGLQEKWDQNVIRQIIAQYVKQHKIKAILTFDSFGISSHPNHKAINSALSTLVKKQKTQTSIKLHELTTVNIFRKYSSILDFPWSLLAHYMYVDLNILDQYRNMSQHKSQFVWYRKLFMLFSRYTIINTYGQHKWIQI